MNTKQEQQNENITRNTGNERGQTDQKDIDTERNDIADESGDPSQTETVPSDADTEEALKHDNLHEDSSLEPDTPGETNQNTQDEAVPS